MEARKDVESFGFCGRVNTYSSLTQKWEKLQKGRRTDPELLRIFLKVSLLRRFAAGVDSQRGRSYRPERRARYMEKPDGRYLGVQARRVVIKEPK